MFDAQHRLSSTLAYVTSMANYIAFFFFFFFLSDFFFFYLACYLFALYSLAMANASR